MKKVNGKRSLWKRVSAGRWLAGFVTAMVLVALVGAVGALLKGIGTAEAPSLGSGSGAAGSLGGTLSIRMEIPGITDPKTPWIELDSYSWGVSQSGTFASGPCPSGSPSRCQASDLVVSKKIDATSPKLMQQAMTGNPLSQVTIDFCRSSSPSCQDKYMTWKLESVMISSVQWGSSNQNIPVESISFNFAKLDIIYMDPKTRVETGVVGWDCSQWPECAKI